MLYRTNSMSTHVQPRKRVQLQTLILRISKWEDYDYKPPIIIWILLAVWKVLHESSSVHHIQEYTTLYQQ